MFNQDQQYLINYSTEGHYSCETTGCDDICRCWTIDRVDIHSVNISTLSVDTFNKIFDENSITIKRDDKISEILFGYKDIDIYCIDRILRINRLYDTSAWEPTWSNSYYGEEIDGIRVNDALYEKIKIQITHLISLDTLLSKIKYILELEYGFILDKLENKSCKIIEIDKKDIIFGQKEHSKNIDTSLHPYYSDKEYDLIRGICLLDGDKWKVIDGYHRLLSTKKEKIKIISFE